jgi:hypothetical protein
MRCHQHAPRHIKRAASGTVGTPEQKIGICALAIHLSEKIEKPAERCWGKHVLITFLQNTSWSFLQRAKIHPSAKQKLHAANCCTCATRCSKKRNLQRWLRRTVSCECHKSGAPEQRLQA